MKRPNRWLAVLLLALLVAAACGDDDDEGGDAAATDTTEAPDDGGDGDGGEGMDDLDANGDGEIRVGVATPGPRDDGAYYQALVEGVTDLSEEQGWGEPIIVDRIAPADAATELENLARQPVDIIAVGASEIAESLPTVAEQFDEILWYCNCGAGAPPNDFYAQSQDDASEINFTAGYATGLLMQERGEGTKAVFIGNQGFGFEIESFLAFEAGLQEVDESFVFERVDTGSFDDVPAATEAATAAINSGAVAIYPFLGGAHEAVVKLANENDVITMTAGASDGCERTDLEYDIVVRFDAADYLEVIFDELISGELNEGDVRMFKVGVDDAPGAKICDPTPEQEEALDAIYDRVAAGEFAERFGAIKGEAYSG